MVYKSKPAGSYTNSEHSLMLNLGNHYAMQLKHNIVYQLYWEKKKKK